jgi:hypothetical protein
MSMPKVDPYFNGLLTKAHHPPNLLHNFKQAPDVQHTKQVCRPSIPELILTLLVADGKA